MKKKKKGNEINKLSSTGFIDSSSFINWSSSESMLYWQEVDYRTEETPRKLCMQVLINMQWRQMY